MSSADSTPEMAPKRRVVGSRSRPAAEKEPTPAGALAEMAKKTAPQPMLAAAKGTSGGALFLGWTAAGIGLAALGAVPHPITHTIGIIGPVAAAIGYAAHGMQRRLHRQAATRERFADNTYYIGFIFTQAALLLGFLPPVALGVELTSNDILRAFTMALGASMAGLITRTVLIQAGNSVSESQEILENEAEALTRSVTERARVVLGEFDKLGGRLTDAYGELNSELEAAVGSLSATMRRFEDVVQRDAASIEVSTSSLAGVAASTTEDASKRQAKLAANIKSAAEAIERLRADAEAQFHTSTEVLRLSTDALRDGAEALRSAPDLGGAISQINSNLERAAGQVRTLDQMIGGAHTGLGQAVADAIGGVQGAGAEAKEEALRRTGALKAEVDEVVAALERTLNDFKASLERVRV